MEIEEIKCEEFCIPLINEIETAAIYSGFDLAVVLRKDIMNLLRKETFKFAFMGVILEGFLLSILKRWLFAMKYIRGVFNNILCIYIYFVLFFLYNFIIK